MTPDNFDSEEGSGDYTQERDAWLGSLTSEEVIQEIYEMRRKGELEPPT